MIKLTLKDYSHLKKIIKNDCLEYQYSLIIDDQTYTNDQKCSQFDYRSKEYWFLKIITALNIKKLPQRYDYIYETMCDFLDDLSHEYCDFKCNKCQGNRACTSKHTIDGCCYFHGTQCPFLVNKVCQHRSLSCKIFMCDYLEKKYHFKSTVDAYPLLNLFFNRAQKELIHFSYRQTKDMVMPKLLALAPQK